MHSAMDLPTRSIWENRSSADPAGRRVTLVGVAVTLTVSDSETRDVMGVGEIRSDLTSVKMLPSKVEELVIGFLGTMTSGKLPKVKEKPTVASIWAMTLAEKTMPMLVAIELDV